MDGSIKANSLESGSIDANRTVLICGARSSGWNRWRVEPIPYNCLETLEVQLDKKTVKRLRIGERELKKRQYKVASSREDIDRILSS